jgi:serine/threonine protein phosphatase 1
MVALQENLFVFSDIHGCLDEFNGLLETLPLNDDSELIFLGDYIDRGHDSKGVIDRILDLSKQYKVTALKGNHEQMFLHFLDDLETPLAASFAFNGGGATLASYSDQFGVYEVPQTHLDFLHALPLFHETDDYFFVHAGVPNIPLHDISEDNEHELLWIRRDFFESIFDWGKTIVHGHTPINDCEILPYRINIDTGCVFGNKLSALALPSQEVYHIEKSKPIINVCLKQQDSNRKAQRFSINTPVTVFHKEELLYFKTVDYSEYGMLVCAQTPCQTPLFNEGEKLHGVIGIQELESVPYKGQVVRIVQKHIGIFYAIEFTQTPFELTTI